MDALKCHLEFVTVLENMIAFHVRFIENMGIALRD
jgi:hypothetical protein